MNLTPWTESGDLGGKLFTALLESGVGAAVFLLMLFVVATAVGALGIPAVSFLKPSTGLFSENASVLLGLFLGTTVTLFFKEWVERVLPIEETVEKISQ